MFRLLFIEDQKEAVQPVISEIEKNYPEAEYELCDFDNAENCIKSWRPNIVILDLLKEGASAESVATGLNTHEFIWNNRFCPIIVYSAQPRVYEDENEQHPFVKTIQKGRGSPKKVLKVLDEFSPHVEALTETEAYITQEFASVMRDVAPYAFEEIEDEKRRSELIRRSGRRRLAARVDELTEGEAPLESWEQYLYPPVSSDPLLGDIIQFVGSDNKDPASFRVVLTPSCDLASPKGKRKVENVLVAKCLSIKDGLSLVGLGGVNKKKLEDRLPQNLASGFIGSVIPFPNLPGKVPHMMANLRDLELIPVQDIVDDTGKKVSRIASLDSPFRELIAWAYMNNACRPGLPVRNHESWCKEIITDLNAKSGKH